MKKEKSQVSLEYLPHLFDVLVDEKVVINALDELELEALGDTDAFKVYYPGESMAYNHMLKNSAKFASKHPWVEINGKRYDFSFLKTSLQPQPALNGHHLDGNIRSGIEVGTPARNKKAWRALINLSMEPRHLSYSLQDPDTALLEDHSGLWTARDLDPSFLKEAIIPGRIRNMASGLVFCASHVLHGGVNTQNGRYLAGYCREETA